MSTDLPTLDELRAAPDHPSRADWLLRSPLAMLLSEEVTIRQILGDAAFELGLAYLDIEISELRAVRSSVGDCGYYRLRDLGQARISLYMLRVQARADAVQAGADAP